ncbi:hypothetical protein BEL04_12285 [Mucilaginibacter sp. PPCGB 2223]|nr:hypothetical protein BEL04_12285 [Mucilaginibacter sp. PPCGB 2223]
MDIKTDTIKPGELWPDDQGNHVQAHGGGIIKIKDTFYWYGEQRSKEIDTNFRYVSCYSSKDLMNWKFRGNALVLSKPDTVLGKWVLERPKVFFNSKTGKYVMYMHIDGSVRGTDRKTPGWGYAYARVGVAVSDKPTGPFKYIRSFRPLGLESRDIGQFVDDDGTPYLIFESRPSKGFYIAGLSDDYLDADREIAFIQAPLEGGAIVHYKGLYYVVGSALTGWRPNPNKYATATRLSGPWSEFQDIAPPATNTYGAQSTMLLKVVGQQETTVLFMGDQWRPQQQWDSRYLWMPLKIDDGKLWLPSPRPFTIDVKSGKASAVD